MKTEIRKVVIHKVQLKNKKKKPPEDPLRNKYVRDILKFAELMLLANNIRLQDVPLSLRILKSGTYTAALRVDRGFPKERSTQDLEIFKNDMQFISDPLLQRQFKEEYKDLEHFSPK